MKLAMSIVTCVLQERAQATNRLRRLVETLLPTEKPPTIFIVDDGSTSIEHLQFLDSLRANGFWVTNKERRTGISAAKNTALRLLRDSSFDFGFLVEDDVEFRQPDWMSRYVEAHMQTQIDHFSLALDGGKMIKEPRKVNNYEVVHTCPINGVFLTVTPKMIAQIGGFPVLPGPWGVEHVNWTNRMRKYGFCPFYADIVDSNRYLGCSSHARFSTVTDDEKNTSHAVNKAAITGVKQKYFPLVE